MNNKLKLINNILETINCYKFQFSYELIGNFRQRYYRENMIRHGFSEKKVKCLNFVPSVWKKKKKDFKIQESKKEYFCLFFFPPQFLWIVEQMEGDFKIKLD